MRFIDRIGENHITNEGYEVEIINFNNSRDCSVRFTYNNHTIRNLKYLTVKNGHIKNPYHPSVYEIGFVGLGVYDSKEYHKFYTTWNNLLKRTYDKKNQTKYFAYKNVTVCKDWHCFQNFAEWLKTNYVENFHLDKDILFKGNKIYSPETCCFVPQDINNLFTKRYNKQGLPSGIKMRCGKYYTKLNDSHLGAFDTLEEAFHVYKNAKEQYIKEVANKWKNKITEKVYQALINYQVEIID